MECYSCVSLPLEVSLTGRVSTSVEQTICFVLGAMTAGPRSDWAAKVTTMPMNGIGLGLFKALH